MPPSLPPPPRFDYCVCILLFTPTATIEHCHHHRMPPPITAIASRLYFPPLQPSPLSSITIKRHRPPSPPAAATIEIHLCRHSLAATPQLTIAASIEQLRTPPPPSNVSSHHRRQQVAGSLGRGRHLMMMAVSVRERERMAAAAGGGGC